MKLINKHNFLSISCVVFTLISIGKLMFELLDGSRDEYYIMNFLTIFLFSLLGTFVLSLHNYFQEVPLLPVILIQYVILFVMIMGGLWVIGHWIDLEPSGYKDMFRSFTIPYVIGAVVYYISFFTEVRKANNNLQEIRRNQDED